MTGELTPIDGGAWGRGPARHLLNRAAFGVPWSAIAALAAAGPVGAVDGMLNTAAGESVAQPDFVRDREHYREEVMMAVMKPNSPAGEGAAAPEAAKQRRMLVQEQRAEMVRLKAWWAARMRATPTPLVEKLALFWHGHFATSAREVRLPLANWELNQVFRENAAGNFRTMVFEVGKTPAMLEYLDNRRNRKDSPNENWARELMELFTLGIGNYTEQDIREAARAFTGYTERGGEFVFVARQHDPGVKTFLGVTGNHDGADVINIILQQPQCARFICRKMWEFFAYGNPSDDIVEGLAATLREADYELKPMLRQMFLSRAFYSERAVGTQIKSPAQFVVMLGEQLQLDGEGDLLVDMGMRSMGQDLFYPPNVKGWPIDRGWISTSTLLARYNLPGYLLTGERLRGMPVQRLDDMPGEADARAEDARPKLPTGPARRGAVRDARRQAVQRRAGLDVEALFAPLAGMTTAAALDRVVDQLLTRPLDPVQRAPLMAALGTDDAAPFDPAKLGNARLSALLHLVLSTAEYQLC